MFVARRITGSRPAEPQAIEKGLPAHLIEHDLALRRPKPRSGEYPMLQRLEPYHFDIGELEAVAILGRVAGDELEPQQRIGGELQCPIDLCHAFEALRLRLAPEYHVGDPCLVHHLE